MEDGRLHFLSRDEQAAQHVVKVDESTLQEHDDILIFLVNLFLQLWYAGID